MEVHIGYVFGHELCTCWVNPLAYAFGSDVLNIGSKNGLLFLDSMCLAYLVLVVGLIELFHSVSFFPVLLGQHIGGGSPEGKFHTG